MTQFRNVLLPTDFSAISDATLAYAAYICNKYDADLHIVHVNLSAELESSGSPDYYPLEKENWSSSYYEYVNSPSLQNLQVHSFSTSEISGKSVPDALLKYAELHDIDLIVLGTHGHRGLRRFLLGSTAEEVVHLAQCPVLTVRRQENILELGIRRILVPIDFSQFSLKALNVAKHLATTFNARLDLLHVIQPITFPQPYGVTSPNIVTPKMREKIQQALDDLGENSKEIEVTTHIENGFPAYEIDAFARKHEVDLIVIASHGLTGFNRLIQGSTTQEVLRLAPCPVFTVKSQG